MKLSRASTHVKSRPPSAPFPLQLTTKPCRKSISRTSNSRSCPSFESSLKSSIFPFPASLGEARFYPCQSEIFDADADALSRLLPRRLSRHSRLCLRRPLSLVH